MDGLPKIECTWKRPAEIEYPKIWHRFETKPKDGKTYKIRIEDLTEDRFTEVIDFLMKYYFTEEPLSVESGILQDQLSLSIYQYLLTEMMAQNVSIVAVIDDDSPKPELVGLQILSVASKEDDPLPEVPGEAIGKKRKIYKDVRKNCDPFAVLGADRYLNEWGLCVAPQFRRLGVASNILDTLTAVGKAYGLKGTMIMFTRIESQRAAEKTGFEVYNEIVYADYKDDQGSVIFAVQGGTKVLKLMGKLF